jgi:hypothetical protein
LAGVGFEGGELAHDALEVVWCSVRVTGIMAGAGAVGGAAAGRAARGAASGFGSGGKRWSPAEVRRRM